MDKYTMEIDTQGMKKCPKCGSTDRLYVKGKYVNFESGKYAYYEQ